jgi:hypothetical protein
MELAEKCYDSGYKRVEAPQFSAYRADFGCEVHVAIAIDLTGKQDEIEAVWALAQQRAGVEVSEPGSLDASRALNVGMPGVSPTEILSMLTLVFTTAKAGLEFLKALREFLNARGTVVAVSESATGKSLGRIEPGSTDQALAKVAGQ